MKTREELLALDRSGSELYDFLRQFPAEVDRLLPEMVEWTGRFRMHALTGTPMTLDKLLKDWKSFHHIVKIVCWGRVMEMTDLDLKLAKALHKMCADDIIEVFMYSLPNP